MINAQIKTCLIFLCLSISVFAQNDSVMIPGHQTTPEKYDSIYKKYVKDKEEEIRHIWKINLADAGLVKPAIGYEQKIGKNWSSDSYLKVGLPWKAGLYSFDLEWEVSQQLKYYYNLNRREKLGRRTNGFSGNYIAINLFAGENCDPKPGFEKDVLIDKDSYYGIGLNFGMQRRIGRMGFIEPYIGITYQHSHPETFDDEIDLFNFKYPRNLYPWTITPVFGIRAGFNLETFLMPSGIDNETPRHLWKVNLTDVGFFYGNLGFEFAMGRKWTSDFYLAGGIEQMALGGIDRSQYSTQEFGSHTLFEFNGPSSVRMNIEHQFRYYFKSQFNGNYLSMSLLGGIHDYTYYVIVYEDYERTLYTTLKNYGAGIKYGIQKKIGSIAYIDLFAGLNYEFREYPEAVEQFPGVTELLSSTTKGRFVPVIGIRAGFIIGRRSGYRKITD